MLSLRALSLHGDVEVIIWVDCHNVLAKWSVIQILDWAKIWRSDALDFSLEWALLTSLCFAVKFIQRTKEFLQVLLYVSLFFKCFPMFSVQRLDSHPSKATF